MIFLTLQEIDTALSRKGSKGPKIKSEKQTNVWSMMIILQKPKSHIFYGRGYFLFNLVSV